MKMQIAVRRLVVIAFVSLVAVYIFSDYFHWKFSKTQMLVRYKENVYTSYFIFGEEYANCVKGIVSDEMAYEYIKNATIEFSSLMEKLAIESVLLEPLLLFCVVSADDKALLLRQGFNLTSLPRTSNVLSFALKECYTNKIESVYADSLMNSRGYQLWPVETPAPTWYKEHCPKGGNITTHYFLQGHSVIIHIVVLFDRGNYYWHGRLNSLPKKLTSLITVNQVPFTQNNSAYERFSAIPVQGIQEEITSLKIPCNPTYFLAQIPISAFMECKPKSQFIKQDIMYAQKEERLMHDFFLAIEEIKAQLNPMLMKFIILGGTVLGWYRQCGMIPYTSDIDFASFAENIIDEDSIVNAFKDNQLVTLKEIMGFPEEAFEFRLQCRNTRVDLFFLYEDSKEKTYWMSGHRPSGGYYFRYSYPKFTICSADLLGHKVHVPCETESVIVAEYGPNWSIPVHHWNYESSSFNIGPKKYWPKEKRDKASRNF